MKKWGVRVCHSSIDVFHPLKTTEKKGLLYSKIICAVWTTTLGVFEMNDSQKWNPTKPRNLKIECCWHNPPHPTPPKKKKKMPGHTNVFHSQTGHLQLFVIGKSHNINNIIFSLVAQNSSFKLKKGGNVMQNYDTVRVWQQYSNTEQKCKIDVK